MNLNILPLIREGKNDDNNTKILFPNFHKDSRYGFEFRYPGDWDVYEFTSPTKDGFNTAANLCPNTDYTASGPLRCLGSNNWTTVNVNKNIFESLSDFVNNEIMQFQLDYFNVTMIDKRSTTFAGLPAIQVSFTASNEDGDAERFMHTIIWTKSGQDVYSVYLISPPRNNPEFPSTVKQILESFKIN